MPLYVDQQVVDLLYYYLFTPNRAQTVFFMWESCKGFKGKTVMAQTINCRQRILEKEEDKSTLTISSTIENFGHF